MELQQVRDRVLDALGRPEGRHLDFKAARNNFEKESVCRYAAAFANERGGLLVLGVEDRSHEVIGTNAFRDLQEVARYVYQNTQTLVRAYDFEIDGKRIVAFDVPSRPLGQPARYKGRYLIRAGESVEDMPEQQLMQILNERQDDVLLAKTGVTVAVAELADVLDVDGLYSAAGMPTPTGRDLIIDLERRNLIVQHGANGTVTITKLGAVATARDLGRFPELQTHRVRVIRYAGVNRVHATNDRFFNEGYVGAFSKIIAHVEGLLPVTEEITSTHRVEESAYSPLALREFLANALVHQNFDLPTSSPEVDVFDDRVEIRNPGVPLIDVRRFVDETVSRNPHLAELLRIARICEQRGSGVDRALGQIEEMIKPAPEFRSLEATTLVTMPLRRDFSELSMPDRVWAAFLHACLRHQSGARMTNSTLRERFGLAAGQSALVSQTITAAIDHNLVVRDPASGTSKRGAAYLPYFAV